MDEKKKSPLKGVRIRTVNYGMIFVSCLLYISLIYATIQATIQYEDLIIATQDCIDYQADALLVTNGSDHLMEQVQLYAVTADPGYVEAYFTEVNVTRRRDRALEHLNGLVTEEAYLYLQTALECSNQLMEREIYSMRLITEAQGYDLADFPPQVQAVTLTSADAALSPEEKTERGRSLVLGPDYMELKEAILENVEQFLNATVTITNQRQQKSASTLKSTMLRQKIFISILFILNIVTFILILVLIVRPLQIYIKCIKEEKMLEIIGSYEFRHLALTYNDIYALNAANETLLRHQAEHDPLTGIMNRGAFDRSKQLLKASRAPLALLIIDVDRFKLINDGYGHETGDQIIKKVAMRLENGFRSKDIPARIGGDEFAVIVTDITPDLKSVIKNKVDHINHILQHPDDGLPPVSLSVGAAFSDNGFDDGLYKRADQALYQVKENGRCGCCFYEEVCANDVPEE